MLGKTEYDPKKDLLILMGDYMDRGPQSRETLSLVIELAKDGAVALRGNHDQMFLDWLSGNHSSNDLHFFMNGGFATISSYLGYGWFKENGYDEELVQKAKEYIRSHYQEHIEFLSELDYFYETKEYIFVHAGINPLIEDWRYTDIYDYIWIRDGFLHTDHHYAFTVIHGHTPARLLHKRNDIFFGNKKIGIDGSCAYGGQLNCLEITEAGFRQYTIRNQI